VVDRRREEIPLRLTFEAREGKSGGRRREETPLRLAFRAREGREAGDMAVKKEKELEVRNCSKFISNSESHDLFVIFFFLLDYVYELEHPDPPRPPPQVPQLGKCFFLPFFL
jgi:hypothetical protein